MRKDKQQFFEQVLAQYRAKDAETNGGTGIPILTQSSLRLEQYVSANTTLYNFPVLTGVTTPGTTSVLPTETRLQQNDNFHIYSISFYLAVTAASTDTAFRLQTNPNEIFLGSAAIALNYLNIYNGNMNINVNQVDVLTNWRLSRHMFVGQTQRLTGTVNNNFDQVDLSQDGIVTNSPSLMLSGAYTNTITVNLPGAVTSALSNNNSRMIIVFDGLRAQNAAVRKGGL